MVSVTINHPATFRVVARTHAIIIPKQLATWNAKNQGLFPLIAILHQRECREQNVVRKEDELAGWAIALQDVTMKEVHVFLQAVEEAEIPVPNVVQNTQMLGVIIGMQVIIRVSIWDHTWAPIASTKAARNASQRMDMDMDMEVEVEVEV